MTKMHFVLLSLAISLPGILAVGAPSNQVDEEDIVESSLLRAVTAETMSCYNKSAGDPKPCAICRRHYFNSYIGLCDTVPSGTCASGNNGWRCGSTCRDNCYGSNRAPGCDQDLETKPCCRWYCKVKRNTTKCKKCQDNRNGVPRCAKSGGNSFSSEADCISESG